MSACGQFFTSADTMRRWRPVAFQAASTAMLLVALLRRMANLAAGKVGRRQDLVLSQCTTVTATGGNSGESTRAKTASGAGIGSLLSAPIYHAAPLKWCASVQALGGTVVLMERFDAESSRRRASG
jgi:hypothetical protein